MKILGVDAHLEHRDVRRAVGVALAWWGFGVWALVSANLAPMILDVAHFPFVHEGLLGDEAHTEINEYEVVTDENGQWAVGVPERNADYTVTLNEETLPPGIADVIRQSR